jgi:protoheme IX farnesyltransferase
VSETATSVVVLPRAEGRNKAYAIKTYYRLTKPGIVYSNTLTAVSGYLFAVRWHVQPITLISLIAGTMLLIASACVFNNYIDRPLDRRMQRTQKRALVTGAVAGKSALLYASSLGLLGLFALSGTNLLTITIGLGAVFGYVVVYGWAKRHSVHGTLVGTLPGAASLMAGYTAVTGHLDVTSLLLCLIMVTWQMPHFYAIAVRRLDDYAKAGLPVWPVRYGVRSAARQIVTYIVLFIVCGLLLTFTGRTGVTFALCIFVLGILWLRLAIRGLYTKGTMWARSVFLFSLVTLLALAVLLPFNRLLP